jgi:hypothetical protein
VTYVDPEFEEPSEKMVSIPGKELKKYKQQAREGAQAAQKVAELERQNAFFQAGVDPTHPLANYFSKGYEGESNPEAVRAEWDRITGATSQPDDSQIAEEVAAIHAADELIGGGQLPPDKLAERDTKLASLSPTDPRMGEKFDAIMKEYGGVVGSRNLG